MKLRFNSPYHGYPSLPAGAGVETAGYPSFPPNHVQLAAAGGGGLAEPVYNQLYRTSGDACAPIVLYEYQPDRKAKHPEAFLQGFRAYLHADGYESYHRLPEGMVVVGCWAHLRRKFDDALKVLPEAARGK